MTHEGLRKLQQQWEYNIGLLNDIDRDSSDTDDVAYAGKAAAYMTGLETLKRHIATGADDEALIGALQANLEFARTRFEREPSGPGSDLNIRVTGADVQVITRHEIASLEQMVVQAYLAVGGLHLMSDTGTKEN